uniref:Uncharacterized protein n=1 Tax=Marmota marmota marmota TaxID=9994 RepID=A0A8C5ZFI9_MARMA
MTEQPRETLQIRIVGSRSLIWWPISAFRGDPTSCLLVYVPSVDTEYLTVYQLLDLKK